MSQSNVLLGALQLRFKEVRVLAVGLVSARSAGPHACLARRIRL